MPTLTRLVVVADGMAVSLLISVRPLISFSKLRRAIKETCAWLSWTDFEFDHLFYDSPALVKASAQRQRLPLLALNLLPV